jgi:hypothetical protein
MGADFIEKLTEMIEKMRFRWFYTFQILYTVLIDLDKFKWVSIDSIFHDSCAHYLSTKFYCLRVYYILFHCRNVVQKSTD